MSFFKDFKEDLSQAVNELVPGEDTTEAAEQDNDVVVNTLEDELDVESELSKLDGLLSTGTGNRNKSRDTSCRRKRRFTYSGGK